jgi:DNA polymerase I
MKLLLLIDGNAMLHRAFHAMPELTKNGQMVNAVYGFFSMLINVMAERRPTHVAVCFDRSKPTIRQTMYAGYHAHRPPMADGLSGQIATVDLLLEKMKAPIFALDGYEGDDMIGTIATKVAEKDKDMHVLIVTGDRDMLQLVTEQIHVLMPIVGLTKTVEFDPQAVEEKYGVKPSQFIDYKALIGDASDGYPGVNGIGPKTAANLLKEYKTFESLYEQIGDLPEKIGTKLALDAEQAALAKKLAAIITDAPMQLDLKLCEVRGFDLRALHQEFQTLGFNSLIGRLEARFPETKSVALPTKNESDGQLDLL